MTTKKEDWAKLAQKELRDKPLESLTWNTLEGIAAPMLGSVHLPALIGLGLGGVIGAPFGARLAARLPGAAP